MDRLPSVLLVTDCHSSRWTTVPQPSCLPLHSHRARLRPQLHSRDRYYCSL